MSDKLKSIKTMMEVMNTRKWSIVGTQVWADYGTDEATFIASTDNIVVAEYLIESRIIINWLIEQLEQARTMNHNMWECPDCGFAFDAIHTDDNTNEYSCPLCAEDKLEDQLKAVNQALKDAKSEPSLRSEGLIAWLYSTLPFLEEE